MSPLFLELAQILSKQEKWAHCVEYYLPTHKWPCCKQNLKENPAEVSAQPRRELLVMQTLLAVIYIKQKKPKLEPPRGICE